MSRKNRKIKREFKPDSRYNNILIGRFINKIMLDGRKVMAENIVYKALEILSKKVNEEPVEAFNKVIKNVSPLMEVRSRRVGGSTYQVPMEVATHRRYTLAIRWLVNNSRDRSGRSMVEKLSAEFVDAYNNTGATIKQQQDTHKMAEANKAFSHFRW